MSNEALIRKLIRGSIQRAVQESVAGLIVGVCFAVILTGSAPGSGSFYGCLVILVGIGFIAGVVWSHALSYRLLRSHPASDTGYWREAFHAQAGLLRRVSLWYCAPLGVGGILFVAPASMAEFAPFLLVSAIFLVVLTIVLWVNRRAAACLDASAKLLTD